jgi:hypothetical protein
MRLIYCSIVDEQKYPHLSSEILPYLRDKKLDELI